MDDKDQVKMLMQIYENVAIKKGKISAYMDIVDQISSKKVKDLADQKAYILAQMLDNIIVR